MKKLLLKAKTESGAGKLNRWGTLWLVVDEFPKQKAMSIISILEHEEFNPQNWKETAKRAKSYFVFYESNKDLEVNLIVP